MEGPQELLKKSLEDTEEQLQKIKERREFLLGAQDEISKHDNHVTLNFLYFLRKAGLKEIGSSLMPVYLKQALDYIDYQMAQFDRLSIEDGKNQAISITVSVILHLNMDGVFEKENLRGRYYDAFLRFHAMCDEERGKFFAAGRIWQYLGDVEKEQQLINLGKEMGTKSDDERMDLREKYERDNLDTRIKIIKDAFEQLKKDTEDFEVNSEELVANAKKEIEKQLELVGAVE